MKVEVWRQQYTLMVQPQQSFRLNCGFCNSIILRSSLSFSASSFSFYKHKLLFSSSLGIYNYKFSRSVENGCSIANYILSSDFTLCKRKKNY